MSEPLRPLMSPGEAARVLGIHPQTLARRAAGLGLTIVRTPNGHRRYVEAEIRALAARVTP